MLNLLTRFFPRRAYYAIVDAVRFALRSPFSVLFHAPSQHRQLSQNAVLHAYLLFVKGFIYPISVDYNARNCGCQQVLCFFTEFSGFSPSLTLLRPERMRPPACNPHRGETRDPLAVRCYLPVGKNGISELATAFIGMLWSITLPGPVTTVLKIPSPPNTMFFIPGTVLMSMEHVASIAARYPVSTTILCPACRLVADRKSVV